MQWRNIVWLVWYQWVSVLLIILWRCHSKRQGENYFAHAMSIYHWIILYAADVNCVTTWYIDGIFIKSLNFFAGRIIELGCEAQGSRQVTYTFNCNENWDYKCSQTCTLQKCVQTCNGAKCDLECGGPNCEQTCNAQGTCSLKCRDGGECVQVCNGHECSLECDGEHCRQTCNDGACSLKCNGGECEQTCFRDCNLECHGGSCEQMRSELKDLSTCQVHCPVAGHASKCQQYCENKESQCANKFITITEAPTKMSEHYHASTGEWSNASAVVSTGLTKERREERRRDAPFSFPSFFLPILLTFTKANLDQSGETKGK